MILWRTSNPAGRSTFRQIALDVFALLDSLGVARFKAIGVGEVATSPGPLAVLMAVSNAIGGWLHEYPVTPERVLAALAGVVGGVKGGAR